MRALAQGRMRTTYSRNRDASGRREPNDYRVIDDHDEPDCVYCTECRVALAQTWSIKTGRHAGRWGWCTRGAGEGVGVCDTRQEAMLASREALLKEGSECSCTIGRHR